MWLELAWRNVLANARRSSLVCITIGVSVIALVLFAGYMRATSLGLEYSTIRGGIGSFQVTGKNGFDGYSETPLEFGLDPAAREAIEEASDELPVGTRTVPRLTFSGLVSNGPMTLSVSATGVDPTAENAAFGGRNKIVSGHALDDSSPDDAVVLGAELARRLGVKPGDFVTILTSTVDGALNAQDLVLQGTIGTGIPQTELYLLQMKLPTAQALLSTDRLSLMSVVLPEDYPLVDAMALIGRAQPRLETRSWRQLSPVYDQVMAMYRAFFVIFAGFILAVTGFSVSTAILTGVLERTREIGVLRSLGIAVSRVRLAFVLESVVITGAALLIGTGLSVLIGEAVNASHLTAPPPPGRSVGYPFRIFWDGRAVAAIWVAVFVLTIVAAWLASNRISRMKVVKALGAI